jgi:hypothetical protein
MLVATRASMGVVVGGGGGAGAGGRGGAGDGAAHRSHTVGDLGGAVTSKARAVLS